MPKVGGKRKKARSHKDIDAELEKQLPKTFVVKKGDCSAELQQTVHDLRRCFYPNTAMKLQDNSKLDIKAYLKAARYYNVTHLVVLQTKNESSLSFDIENYLRVIKVGQGQMTFRIINYCRMKEVLHHGGQPFSFSFKDPLVILNNFNENGQVKMIGRGLQEMFPAINPEKIKTDRLKRVVSFTYVANKKMIYFRHYKIVVHEGGISNNFAKLINQKSVDLSKFSSIGQYLASLNGDQAVTTGNDNQQKIKLVQMGPRFKLKFVSYKQSVGRGQEQAIEQTENLYPREQEQPYVQNEEQEAEGQSEKDNKEE